MARFNVVLEREECIACERCIGSCSDSLEMADDGLAQMAGGARAGNDDELETDERGCLMDGAEAFPVNIIHIFEGGNKII